MNKVIDYTVVDTFVKVNTNLSGSKGLAKFKAQHPEVPMSLSSYSRRKSFLLHKKPILKKRHLGYHRIDYKIVDAFIKENPAAKVKDLLKTYPKLKICSATFDSRKRMLLGKSASTITKKPQVFTRLWSTQYKDGEEHLISTIKELIFSLQKSGRASKGLEVSQQINPNIIDVREVLK
jgi:hypothetical protein